VTRTQLSPPLLTQEAPQGKMGSQGAISPLTGQQTSSNEATKRAETAATSARKSSPQGTSMRRTCDTTDMLTQHWWTFEEIVATMIRTRETSNRNRQRATRTLSHHSHQKLPAGFNRVSRGDQPLDKTANVFKSSNLSSSNCSRLNSRYHHSHQMPRRVQSGLKGRSAP
jgi:hypothetical protein